MKFETNKNWEEFSKEINEAFKGFKPSIVNIETDLSKYFDISKTKTTGVHIYHNDKGVKLYVSMPSFKKEDIKITFVDGNIKIKTERKHPELESNPAFIAMGLKTSFNESYFVGKNYDFTTIKAKLENGILTVEMLKLISKDEVKEVVID